MMEAKPRRGRPVKKLEGRPRGPLSVRLRDEVRGDLTLSAARHGRSLSEEIEARLEAGLAIQTYLKADWGEDVFAIARSLASSISLIEHACGSTWYDDDKAVEITKLTAAQTVENYKIGIRNELDGWSAIAKKAFEDPTNTTPDEAARIFAARDMTVLPRPKPTADASEEQPS